MWGGNFCAIIVAVYSLLQSGGCIILGTLAILLSECILAPVVPFNTTGTTTATVVTTLTTTSAVPVVTTTLALNTSAATIALRSISNQSPLTSNVGGYFLLNFFRQFFYTQAKCNATSYSVFPEYNMSMIVNPHQTEGWMSGYLASNSFFFIGSLCLLGGLTVKKKWLVNMYLLTLSLVILYDIALMAVFGIDISYATDLKNNSTFFIPPGTPNIPGVPNPNESTKTITLINSIVMLVYFSRFVIFFILNVVCYLYSISTAKRMSKPKTRVGPSIPSSSLYYPEQPGLRQQQQHYHPDPYPPSMPDPPHVSQRSGYRGQVAAEVPPPPYNGLPRSYDNYAHNSDSEFRNRLAELEVPRIPELPREPRNMELELRRKQSPLNHPVPYQDPEVDYVDNGRRQRPVSQTEPKQRGLTERANSPLSTSMDSIKEGSVRPGPRRTSNSSVSSETIAPELKGQLPWSYVRPGQLPAAGSNKLREFYMNKQKSGQLSSLAAPQESDEESYATSSKVSSHRRY